MRRCFSIVSSGPASKYVPGLIIRPASLNWRQPVTADWQPCIHSISFILACIILWLMQCFAISHSGCWHWWHQSDVKFDKTVVHFIPCRFQSTIAWFWCSSTVKRNTTPLHTHTTVLGPSWILSGTTHVSRHQKGKTNLDSLEQEIVSGSGINWAICNSAPHPRQITMPASHHSVSYRPDALPAAQPAATPIAPCSLLLLLPSSVVLAMLNVSSHH